MNIYKALNDMIEYIENNLEEKIDYNYLSRFIGCNSYTLQRLFSLLTNMSIAEYIRKRRLSRAGEDLYNSNELIMDIAIKYQYENATSFSRAFTEFHGIKPSEVNKKSNLKIFPRITFEEQNNNQEEIPYSILESEEKVLYGLKISVENETISQLAPAFYLKNQSKYLDTYGPINYGMTEYADEERLYCKAYWVLYEKEVPDSEKVIIPASKWLVFQIPSQEAVDIQSVINKFYETFIPSCQYNLSALPELEYYHDDITELLIPIQTDKTDI